jgi:hypothetical protein
MPPVDPGSTPITTYDSWPGIDSATQVRVHRDKLRAIADRLEAHLNELLKADAHLLAGGRLQPAAFGGWDAAKALAPSHRTGHDALVEQHTRFLSATLDIIKKLRQTAHVYDEHEAVLEARIREVLQLLQGGSTVLGARPGTQHMPAPSRTAPGSLDPLKG